jgi:hypothetical protein
MIPLQLADFDAGAAGQVRLPEAGAVGKQTRHHWASVP